MKSPIYLLLIGAIGLLGLPGCGEKPQKADPATARSALQSALDAWKVGEKLEDYQKKVAPVVVSDPQWEKGTKLTNYSLESNESQIGFDLKFSVKLSLEDKSGNKTEQKTTCNVSTSPALVVKRAEDHQ
jgi:hypothetical protein